MFDPSIFMASFEAHGLATRAYRLDVSDTQGFVVGFVQPEQDILGGDAHSAAISIEYASVAAPGLVPGQRLRIAATDYRVNNNPAVQGDGTFTRAELERIA